MCRYTPACEEFIFDIYFLRAGGSRDIIHVSQIIILMKISRCMADIYTNWPWFICYYAMLNLMR